MAAISRRALATYDKKRDFAVTSEPRGGPVRKRATQLAFVVQKHDATRLHYDFRLEHDGVLWSWAVPKGPSLDPSVRRLAARTEDHPLEYASFEGTIPEHEYGGGPVIVWDRGTWEPVGKDPARGMKDGHLRFTLHGEKLRGAFHLVRLRAREGQKESWLFFKSKDDAAVAGSEIVDEQPGSVISGRSIEDVREGRAANDGVKKKKPNGKTKTEPLTLATALESMNLGFDITSPEKILEPTSGLTKAELMAYFVWVAPRMLPLVRGRPLMLRRCPEGRTGDCFYQKHGSPGMPAAIRRVHIAEKTARGESLVIDDVAGLVALGQMGVLEIHTWMAHAERVERPDMMVLDVDPDEALPFERVIETAVRLRDAMKRVGLVSFVKTTGGKGLHVVAPVTPGLDWDAHVVAARRIAEHLAERTPGLYVTTMTKAARRGKIFLDFLRNGRGATAIAPYSPRAKEGAPVATPLTWAALEKGVDPRALTVRALVEAGLGGADPWDGFATLRQSIDARALARL